LIINYNNLYNYNIINFKSYYFYMKINYLYLFYLEVKFYFFNQIHLIFFLHFRFFNLLIISKTNKLFRDFILLLSHIHKVCQDKIKRYYFLMQQLFLNKRKPVHNFFGPLNRCNNRILNSFAQQNYLIKHFFHKIGMLYEYL